MTADLIVDCHTLSNQFLARCNERADGMGRQRFDVGRFIEPSSRQMRQSGEVDYTGSITKRGDVRVRTLLYEAANVMLTRYAAPLKLKSWALEIGRRSTMRKARVALARRLAIILHAMMRDQTDFQAV